LLKVGHRPTPTRRTEGKPTTGGGKSYKPGRSGKTADTAGGPGGIKNKGGKPSGGGKPAGSGRAKKRR